MFESIQPSRLPVAARPDVHQGFLKGAFHLLFGRIPGKVSSHGVEVFCEVGGVLNMLTLKRTIDNLGKVTLGRHARRARLGLKRRRGFSDSQSSKSC